MSKYFFFISHLVVAFAVAAMALFSADIHLVSSFGDFQSSCFRLMQLLCFAQGSVSHQLVDFDSRTQGMFGILYLGAFTFLVVLTGSAIIVSIICEYWAISTEQQRGNAGEKAELQKIKNLHDEIKNLGYGHLMESATDEDLDQLAKAQDLLVEEASTAARQCSPQASIAAPQASSRSGQQNADKSGTSKGGANSRRTGWWINPRTRGLQARLSRMRKLREESPGGGAHESGDPFEVKSSSRRPNKREVADNITHALEAVDLGGRDTIDIIENSAALSGEVGHALSRAGTSAASQALGLGSAVDALGGQREKFEGALDYVATHTLGRAISGVLKHACFSTSMDDELQATGESAVLGDGSGSLETDV